jgi:hypothetical protein
MMESELLLILNNNSEYASLDLERIINNTNIPVKILDVWSVLDCDLERKDIVLYTIGNIEKETVG